MAIKSCKECGSPVSDKAVSCPNCGNIIVKSASPIMIFMVMLVGIAILYQISTQSDNSGVAPVEMSEKDKESVVEIGSKMAISDLLKDPDSANFKYIQNGCGYVNAKNSFGAYTGYKRYIVNVDHKVLVLEGTNIEPLKIEKLWKKICES